MWRMGERSIDRVGGYGDEELPGGRLAGLYPVLNLEVPYSPEPECLF